MKIKHLALTASLLLIPNLAIAQVNPPGTSLERSFDRAAGTNSSGAYPTQTDGTPSNPKGTAVGRAYDRATESNTTGAYPMNDVKNEAERLREEAGKLLDSTQKSIDRTLGTNSSGSYPAQTDGTPSNPKGTAVGRAYDRATESNTTGAYPQNNR